MRASPGDPQPTLKCGLSAVGAQSGWKCAGTPPPLSHACLVSAFAAGAPAGLGRGDLEPHRNLVLKGSTGNYGGPGGGYTPPGQAQPRSKSARARVYHAPTTKTLSIFVLVVSEGYKQSLNHSGSSLISTTARALFSSFALLTKPAITSVELKDSLSSVWAAAAPLPSSRRLTVR